MLVVLAAAPFGLFKTIEYRKILRSRATYHALAGDSCRRSAQGYMEIASQAEQDAERDLEARRRGRAGVTRATFRFNRDGQDTTIRLRFEKDPPERLSTAAAQFAAAVRAEAGRHRQYASTHDALALRYKSWGPWFPAWARKEKVTLPTDVDYFPASSYSLEESGTIRSRLNGRVRSVGL
jgi:hypothetical protein